MPSNWITIAQAADMLDKSEGDLRALLEADYVETLAAGDVAGEIELAPRDYIERKREEIARAARLRQRRSPPKPKPDEPSEKPRAAEPVNVEEVDDDDPPGDPKLRQVVTDRYNAVVDAIRKTDGQGAAEANAVQLKESFELTAEAIHRMREAHAQTASSIQHSLQVQNQIMENLLTALRSADQNTASVLQYQHDFIDAIRRLPEPLQSIQDVQLGLIELEEQRQKIAKERVRFEETDVGRLVTMIIYILLIVALAGMLSIGWTVLDQLPDLIKALRSPAHGRAALDVLRCLA